MALDLSRFSMTINGSPEISESTIDVINPATENILAKAPDCSAKQLDQAVAAARAALPNWRAKAWSERADMLKKMADTLEANQADLVLCLTQEQGKPLHEADYEIGAAIGALRAHAERELPMETFESLRGRTHQIRYSAIGVVAALAPWNFPVSLAFWKCAPALLAGNTVVLKPSPYTPVTTLKIGELLADLLPKGVLNVISGGDNLGPMLTEHEGIDKVTFTGSTQTGKAVMRSASKTLKKLTLELGGNDPAIILPDADIADIAESIFWAAFRNAGQICIATKRIYVHDSQYDELLERITEIALAIQPAAGDQPGTQMGPVQNKKQYERVNALISEARQAGSKVICSSQPLPPTGYFISPTIVANPPEDSSIVQEEPFGPVVPILRYTDIDDVIARANASDFGLGATVWSENHNDAVEVASQLEAGTVWINSAASPDPDAPFGGLKQSGIGVENGVHGLKEFVNQTVIAL